MNNAVSARGGRNVLEIIGAIGIGGAVLVGDADLSKGVKSRT
jgi:hypothetical protein